MRVIEWLATPGKHGSSPLEVIAWTGVGAFVGIILMWVGALIIEAAK